MLYSSLIKAEVITIRSDGIETHIETAHKNIKHVMKLFITIPNFDSAFWLYMSNRTHI
jgi:hypothetical protein